MSKTAPLVSICIPCFKRLEQVRNTLFSIYEDNEDVDLSLYEVVISDNDPDCELKEVIGLFADKTNLRYIPTSCEGFMNSYFALTYGKGELLKLHNSQNMIRKGMLSEIIRLVKKYKESKPLIYTSNGLLGYFNIRCVEKFNDYMSALSYWSSWSGGMTIWREDFEKLDKVTLNPLFPHTSVMLTQYEKKLYVISDVIYYDVQRIKKRGGHNKFEAFTVHYPSLINECYRKGFISENTKSSIFKSLYTEFIPTLLFNKYIAKIETFEISNFKRNCSKFFPVSAYYIAWLHIIMVPFRMMKRRIIIRLHEGNETFL